MLTRGPVLIFWKAGLSTTWLLMKKISNAGAAPTKNMPRQPMYWKAKPNSSVARK